MEYQAFSLLILVLIVQRCYSGPGTFGEKDSQLVDLDVTCHKGEGMVVRMGFDGPFDGVIFSTGHYRSPQCRYVYPGFQAKSIGAQGSNRIEFRIPHDSCGTKTQSINNFIGRNAASYMENTVVIQSDPFIQGPWDSARKLRCVSGPSISRLVTAKPFQVEGDTYITR